MTGPNTQAVKMSASLFHLAFPVRDLAATRRFYGEILGCPLGRATVDWQDFDFFGHQLSAHRCPGAGSGAKAGSGTDPEVGAQDRPGRPSPGRQGLVDGEAVPIPHFGAVLPRPDWEALAARIAAAGWAFLRPPGHRFPGQAGAQDTFFVADPSGNCLEFKCFAHPEGVFAPFAAAGGAPPVLYLASQSPRRRELLDQLGLVFRCLTLEIDEAWDGREAPADYVFRLAREKALAGRALVAPGVAPGVAAGTALVLGADTTVVQGGQVLGKPASAEEGLAMLAALSGVAHEVYTGVALAGPAGVRCLVSRTEVFFRPLAEAERRAYVASGEGRDKAGGYAIQGRAAVFVARLQGSSSGVVGLPLFETAELLRAAGLAAGPALPPPPSA